MKMKSGIMKTIVLAATAIAVFCFLSGCSNNKKGEVGFFRYRIYDIKGMGGKFAEITGLTEEGAKQKVLIVPKEVGGVKVTRLMDSQKYLFDTVGQWKSDALEKVFLYEDYHVVKNIFTDCLNLKEICIIKYAPTNILKINWELGGGRYCYICADIYFLLERLYNDLRPANVTYYYNYADADNYGVYWIDNVAYGERIETIPESPARDGYTFIGWYKEGECVNEWDFDSDTLPDKQTVDDEEVYQETKLFAKWE
ncbi:MAG: InlB B-repeat-containing protein [Clostridiales bacterium]|jgi:uncharacterized repeat protein (TIGR02543 family)|nr:InlB B-repeat-containing protein [Clostridiales bacterium]